MVIGLKSKPQFNGLAGKVCDYDCGRFVVRLDEGSPGGDVPPNLRVKPDNLMAKTAPTPPDGTAAAAAGKDDGQTPPSADPSDAEVMAAELQARREVTRLEAIESMTEQKKGGGAKKDGSKATCAHCGESGAGKKLKACSACKAVNYCSPACQKAAWKAGHKAECSGSSSASSGK